MTTRHLPEPATIERGGRVELRLQLPSPDQLGFVRYDARFFTGEAIFEGIATIAPETEGGKKSERSIVVTATGDAPPDWLVEFTVALLKTTARSARTLGFPRRLTRWRKPRGADGSDDSDD